MKLVAACWLLLLPWVQAQTLRLNWKPADFEPLAYLPWKDDDLHEVPRIIERIFREPNPDIRYPVLAEYLRQVPMIHFALAFDIAVMLEGKQAPSELVAFMLRIWAERDPQGAWERTQSLVRLVGIEHGVLQYDSWNGRPKIQVQDLAAIRASRYWLGRSALRTFPLGVEDSEAPESEKVRLLKAFADLWFDKFQCWPREVKGRYPSVNPGVIGTLKTSAYESLRKGDVISAEDMNETQFEAGLMNWIYARPLEGPAIVQRILRQHWPVNLAAQTPEHDASISKNFLLMWSQTSFSSLMDWQAKAEQSTPEAVWMARCIMMMDVEGQKGRANLKPNELGGEKWLSGLSQKELGDRLHMLAPWNPELAMAWAVRAKDAEMIEDVANTAVYGFGGTTWNRSHAGLGFINSFDLQKLPKNLREQVSGEWGIAIMEQWKDVDVGEAARYGYRFLMQQSWPPRADLLRFFSGEDVYPDNSSMIDRTFCSLRVWAVVKPDEMRAWIAKQQGADARTALTWLLEHPWGNE